MIGGNLYELGLFLLAYVPDLAEAAGVKAAVRRGLMGMGTTPSRMIRVRRYSLSTIPNRTRPLSPHEDATPQFSWVRHESLSPYAWRLSNFGWRSTRRKDRRLLLFDIHTNETVSRMTQITLVKTEIEGKECWAAKLEQKGDDFCIFHPLSSCVMPNLPNRNAPTSQELPLAFNDVLVQNVHTVTGSKTYSGAVYSSACSRNA